MALATATITYDIADLTGVDFDARRTRVWVTTNIPDGTIADTAGNQVRLGDGRGTLADDGTGSVTVWVPGAGSNPASWQTSLHVDYQPRGGGGRAVRTFGPFTITADANLADLVAEQAVPAAAVGGDAAVAGFVSSPSSATAAALSASIDQRVSGSVAGQVQTALSSVAAGITAPGGLGSTVIINGQVGVSLTSPYGVTPAGVPYHDTSTPSLGETAVLVPDPSSPSGVSLLALGA